MWLSCDWSGVYQAQSAEPSDTKFEATPLVVDGVMYTVPPPNDVVALDAATGQVRWTKPYTVAPTARQCCGRVNRGLGVLGDTLFMGTLDGYLLAINAKDGRTIWKVAVGRPEAGYSLTHAPLVIKDTVIVGTAGGEFCIRGFLAAFDANTGMERWRFYTVPGLPVGRFDPNRPDRRRHGSPASGIVAERYQQFRARRRFRVVAGLVGPG